MACILGGMAKNRLNRGEEWYDVVKVHNQNHPRGFVGFALVKRGYKRPWPGEWQVTHVFIDDHRLVSPVEPSKALAWRHWEKAQENAQP